MVSGDLERLKVTVWVEIVAASPCWVTVSLVFNGLRWARRPTPLRFNEASTTWIGRPAAWRGPIRPGASGASCRASWQ
jgi:hypothetical protein